MSLDSHELLLLFLARILSVESDVDVILSDFLRRRKRPDEDFEDAMSFFLVLTGSKVSSDLDIMS